MNDVAAVPARIVVIGTSKKKLAERFKDLSPERRASRRSSPGAASHRSTASHRPPPNEPRTQFLHDDYMDNDLFVGGRPAQRRREPEVRRRPTMRDEYLSDLSEGEEEVAVRIPEHMPRRPRTIELYNGNARAGLDRESHFGDRGSRFGDRESRYKDWENGTSYEDLDDVNPMRVRYPRRRFVYVNRRRFRPTKFAPNPTPLPKRLPVSIPLEERISILRKHNQMPFVRRNYRNQGMGLPFAPRGRPGFNLKRLQHFVPRDQQRFGFGQRRDRRGGGFRKQWNNFNEDNSNFGANPRKQMTLTDLDQELDEYMKSSKHPRVVA